MRIWRINWTLFWLIIWTNVVLGLYLDQCISPYQYNLRSKAICSVSPENYSCLYDVEQKNYNESCIGKADYVKPGYRYVIKGRRANGNCSDSTYQPVKFWSNRSSECEFIKNKCSEIGQVIYSNRSTTKDRSCRCDYTNGFDFVVRPINVCYCIPSEEDCSCYRNRCSSGEILTKDYACVAKVNFGVQDGRCSQIEETWTPFFNISSTSRPEESTPHVYLGHSELTVQIFVVILLTTFLGILLLCCISKRIKAIHINNPWDETHVKHILTVNKEFLIEEMDTEMMRRKLYKKTGRKCYSIMNAPLLRKEKAEQIFQNVKKEPPKIIDTVFLKETKMHLIRERLQASDRIFRYKHVEILKERMADNLEDIVKCIKPEMIDGITSILKESENLPEKVDALYDKFNNDDTKITKFITELIELVMDDGLISMLHFVNALVIVGEEKYSKMLLLTKVDFDRQREH